VLSSSLWLMMLTACMFVTRDTLVIQDALCSENLFVNRIVHDPRHSWTEVGLYYVSGYYPSSCLYLKHNVSDTGFSLLLQAKPTQLGPIDRASPYLRRCGPNHTITRYYCRWSCNGKECIIVASWITRKWALWCSVIFFIKCILILIGTLFQKPFL
jgi:hypothetical protein